ncbi:PKD domain-containing protein [Candidatus Falkowbacteria bacterium]|nr:PKD domain-containing protein [Candidatus Falkowbacteria bacterium]
MLKKFLILGALFALLLPVASRAAFDYDLGFHQEDVRIVGGQIIAGKKMSIVARVHNYGVNDVLGYIYFYLGSQPLGEPNKLQVLSGTYDDAWTEVTVPSSTFNIRVVIITSDVIDQRPENNEQQTGLLYPDYDTDNDGAGDQQDSDDDNDGIPDTAETGGVNGGSGTDPQKADTDGDTHSDNDDAFPLDPSRWQPSPVVIPEPKPAPKPKSLFTAPPKTAASSENLPPAAAPAPESVTAVLPAAGAPEEAGDTVQVLNLVTERSLNAVQIIVQSLGWSKYKFQTDVPDDLLDDFTYVWDFGDGRQSADRLVTHRFTATGAHTVRLTVEDAAHNVLTDEVTITTSWFSPGNGRMWALLVVLGLVLTLLLYGLRAHTIERVQRLVAGGKPLAKKKNSSPKSL